jgi:hypothetical protein
MNRRLAAQIAVVCWMFVQLLPAARAQSTLTFSRPTDYVAGYGPISTTAIDLNGDGKIDLVVANPCVTQENCVTGAVNVLMGNGDGTFQPAVQYASGGNDTVSLAVADFNGDGKPDLVVVNNCQSISLCTQSSISVFQGNGDGTFQPAVTTLTISAEGSFVAVGDVNGDGKPDVLVTVCTGTTEDCSNSVNVFLGNGDGTFQPPYNVTVPGTIGNVMVADFNGDGKADLIFQDGFNVNPAVGIMLGNGDGTFRSPVSYVVGGTPGNTMVFGDFNGDGKLDVAIAVQTNPGTMNFVSVLLGNGDGSFQAPKTSSTGAVSLLFLGIAAADFNGDGKLDLASGGIVLLGNGDGTFQVGPTVTSPGSAPTQPAAADFNGDGKPDLAQAYRCATKRCGATGIISVYLNTSVTSAKNPTTSSVSSDLNPSSEGQIVTFAASVSSTAGGTPTGTVIFEDGTTRLARETLSSGVATFATSTLAVGTHSIKVVYGGDADHAGSTSLAISQVVN